MEFNIKDIKGMTEFGKQLSGCLFGGCVLELIGDVGAGKTTLVKGIASGLGVADTVQSPSFTISRVYECANGLNLHHYDFYRLPDAGLMANELTEVINDDTNITVVEWGGAVNNVMINDRLTIYINTISDDERNIKIVAGGQSSQLILERLK